MQKEYQKRIVCIVFALIVCLSCFGTVTASAESLHSVSETVEKTVFVTFKRETTESRGNVISAVYYFANTYQNDEYDYGVVIFPEAMMQQYGLQGDYIARKEAEGLPISMIIGNGYASGNGYINIYSIKNIPESATNMRIVFVFFVRNADGEIAYSDQRIASFNEITVEAPSEEELLTMAIERKNEVDMEKTLGVATQKIEELIDSIWIYLVIATGSVAVIWGAYIGIRIAVAKKKDEQINAKGMVIRFLVGIVVMFVLAGGLPLLIRGMSAWAA